MSLVPISERNITSLDIASRWRELTGPVADVIELRYSAVAFNTGDAISINLRGQNVDQGYRTMALTSSVPRCIR